MALPATRWRPRCWRTASTSWGGRSSITARAGSSRRGSEEPNALCAVDRGGGRVTPNLRMTQVELYEGLVARSQNRWPSLRFDIGAVNGLLAPIFAAGFYYKTFMGPPVFGGRSSGPKCSSRRSGARPASARRRPSPIPIPMPTASPIARCWSSARGPAGLAAALARRCHRRAGDPLRRGHRTRRLSLLNETRLDLDGQAATDWVEATVERLAAMPNVTLLPRTQAFGYYAHNFVALSERLTDHLPSPAPGVARERMWQVRAKQVVLRHGRHRAPPGLPRQRPAGCDAGGRRPHLPQPLRRTRRRAGADRHRP